MVTAGACSSQPLCFSLKKISIVTRIHGYIKHDWGRPVCVLAHSYCQMSWPRLLLANALSVLNFQGLPLGSVSVEVITTILAVMLIAF